LTVLVLIDGLWVGGAERSLAEMIPLLGRQGVKVVVGVLRRRPGEGVEEEVIRQGIEICCAPGQGFAVAVRWFRKLVRQLEPDLIHTSLFQANMCGRIGAFGTGVPVLCSLVATPYDPSQFRSGRIRSAKLRILQVIDAVTSRLMVSHFHAVSNAVGEAATARLWIPQERISVMPRGRDPKRLGEASAERRASNRVRLGIAPEEHLLVNVGRCDPQKGQIDIIEAVALLRSRGIPIRALIVGREGSASSELSERVRQRGLSASVTFTGNRDDVGDILSAADLFVFPSRYEGFPGAVLEAMALRLAVVASDIPPTREVVVDGESGIFVRPESAFALAEAIERLLKDGALRERLGSRGLELFRGRYTLESAAEGMAQLYRQVASGGRKARSHVRH
jgi:glycosyltransferase involved in cell wall biosynthesis